MDSCKEEAKRAAIRSLAVRSQSSATLETKLLKKGFPPEACQFAIQEMKRLGYLDDDAFLTRSIEIAIDRGYGPRWIEAKLVQKGYDRGKIQSALRAQYPLSRQKEVVARLNTSAARLMRRGFSGEVTGWDWISES